MGVVSAAQLRAAESCQVDFIWAVSKAKHTGPRLHGAQHSTAQLTMRSTARRIARVTSGAGGPRTQKCARGKSCDTPAAP